MSSKQYPIGRVRPGPCWVSGLLDGSECEHLTDYGEGGLCPVLLGDTLSGQNLLHEKKECSFKVIGKLGAGSFSTVWLGREVGTGEFLALKLLRQEHSTSDNSEMRILRKLGKLRLAFFHTHVSTQNKFLCLGLTPMGSSLRDRFNAEVDAPNSLPSIVTFVKTLLAKVTDLHRQGICHGDISHGNVALAAHPDAFTPESLKQTFGNDRTSEVTLMLLDEVSGTPPPRPINLPKYMIARDGPTLSSNVEDMSLVDIFDYGKAFEGTSKKDVRGTTLYGAPEVERNATNITTQKSDLWSLGCVIVYAITYSHLFWTDQTDCPVGDDEQLRAIISERFQYVEMFKAAPEFRDLMVRLIHSLVRVNPATRDPEEARRIVKQLEKLAT